MIDFTDAALEHFRRNMTDGQSVFVHLKRSGCSGYAYLTTIVDHVPEDLQSTQVRGLTVCYRPEDAGQLAGLVIDYRRSGLNHRVVYVNPNEVARCGCGESVSFGRR